MFVQKIKGDRDEFSIEIPSRVYAVAIGPKIAMSFGQGLQSVFFQNGSDAGRILAAHLEDAKHELHMQLLLESESAKKRMFCAAGSALLAQDNHSVACVTVSAVCQMADISCCGTIVAHTRSREGGCNLPRFLERVREKRTP